MSNFILHKNRNLAFFFFFLRDEVFHDRVESTQSPICDTSFGQSTCGFTLDGSTSNGDAQIILFGDHPYAFQIWGIEDVTMTLDRTTLRKIGDTSLYQTTNVYVRGIWKYSDSIKTSSVSRFLFFFIILSILVTLLSGVFNFTPPLKILSCEKKFFSQVKFCQKKKKVILTFKTSENALIR